LNIVFFYVARARPAIATLIPESVTANAVTEIFVRCVVIAQTTAGFFDGHTFLRRFKSISCLD